MDVLQMFGLLDQEIDSWFMNQKLLIPTLPYTILLLFFTLPIGQLLQILLRGQSHPLVVISCVLLILTQSSPGAFWWGWVKKLGQAPSQLNQEPFDISCNTLSHKATYSKSVSSQLWWTETITYELHEYGTTQEFTSWIFPSINIQFA